MPPPAIIINNQRDLIAAFATIDLANTPGTYTMTLGQNVQLGGDIGLYVPFGATVTLNGSGFNLFGAFSFAISGAGTIVLNATNLATGSGSGYAGSPLAILGNAVVELARPDAGGLGLIAFNTTYYNTGATLRVDGATPPLNPIGLEGGSNLHNTIDLTGISSTAKFTTLDLGQALDIPLTGGGTAVLQLTNASGYHNFLLVPDGSGGTLVLPTNQTVANAVLVAGVGSAILSLPLGDPLAAGPAQNVVGPINNGVTLGTLIPFDLAGGPPPTVPSGKALELITQTTGSFTIPATAGAFVDSATGPVSLHGSKTAGVTVASGNGGLTYTSDTGTASVMAGGGTNFLAFAAQSKPQFALLGGGTNTVLADGADTVQTAGGNNLIVLGHGASTVISAAADTILGGTAPAYIDASTGTPFNSDVVFLGAGDATFGGGNATTLVGGSGNATIQTFIASPRPSLYFLGTANNSVLGTGADTIVASSGTATITESAALIFAGSGTLNLQVSNAHPGVTTLVGSASGATTITGEGQLLAFANAPLTYNSNYGAATIVSSGAAINVYGGSAGGNVFIGGSAGGNNIYGGNGGYLSPAAVIVAGGNGDTLWAGNGNAIIQAGSGAETLIGGSYQFGGLDLFAFTHGTVGTIEVLSFSPARDYLTLTGFPAGEAAAALGSATTSAGSETLALSDGTHITFQGFTGLTTASFL